MSSNVSQADLAKANKAKDVVDKVAAKIRSPTAAQTGVDFTLHTLENGDTVHTTERICKGVCLPVKLSRSGRVSLTLGVDNRVGWTCSSNSNGC